MRKEQIMIKVLLFIMFAFGMVMLMPVNAKAAAKKPYVIFDNSDYLNQTFTLYYDSNTSRVGKRYSLENLNIDDCGDAPWFEIAASVDTVIFDYSFKEYKPTSTAQWFYGFTRMREIRNLNYLDTSLVTDMGEMFMYCFKLESLDLSTFKTSRVKEMGGMFRDCNSLKYLNVSKFDTSEVVSMGCMFCGCSSLESLNVSNFDTSKVTDMNYMFSECSNLTSLDVTNFNTINVENFKGTFSFCSKLNTLDLSSFDTMGFYTGQHRTMYLLTYMFAYDTNLKTIYVSSSWDNYKQYSLLKRYAEGNEVFVGCTSLVGENGTKYDPSNRFDGQCAQVDKGASGAGYFTLKRYQLDFKGGKGTTGTAPKTISEGAGIKIKLPACTFSKKGYKFVGWSDGKKIYAAGSKYTMPQNAVTMTAQWEEASKYTVSFSGGQNAKGDSPSSIKDYEGSKVSLPQNKYKRTLYKFVGWTDGKKTYKEGEKYTIPSKSITLTAVWEYVPSNVPKAPASNITAPNSVNDFINRCYQVALGRYADSVGYEYWLGKLNGEQYCGAQIGYGFINSDEYRAKNTSNEQYLNDLYQMFFDREPDEGGYRFWMDKMNAGAGREEVFAGFANSDEFFDLCSSYGVARGVYVTGYDLDAQGRINCYVARLYKVCFNRLPDKNGHVYWVQKLLTGEETGTSVAKSMIFSQEFKDMKLNDKNYVAYLYRAIFGREPGKDEFNYWLKHLVDGTKSKDDVFNEFSTSQEFIDMCGRYGIRP